MLLPIATGKFDTITNKIYILKTVTDISFIIFKIKKRMAI